MSLRAFINVSKQFIGSHQHRLLHSSKLSRFTAVDSTRGDKRKYVNRSPDKRRDRRNGYSGDVEKSSKRINFDPVIANFIETSVPTIFTSDQLSPEIDQSPYAAETSRVFKLPGAYVSPATLNYAFPTKGVPEFAFIGRSNVGKSSLIGTLLGQKSLVRISKEPGCTRSVNYFSLGMPGKEPKLYLVDLPGYGFAKTARTEQEKWAAFIQDYLLNRHPSVLRRTFILIDSRRGVKEGDIEMMRKLDGAHVPYQLILTKSDVSSAKELNYALGSSFGQIMAKKMSSCMPFVHVVSSKSGDGIVPLQRTIIEIREYNWGEHSALELNRNVGGMGAEAGFESVGKDEDMLASIMQNLPQGVLEKIQGYVQQGNVGQADDIVKELNSFNNNDDTEEFAEEDEEEEEEEEEEEAMHIPEKQMRGSAKSQMNKSQYMDSVIDTSIGKPLQKKKNTRTEKETMEYAYVDEEGNETQLGDIDEESEEEDARALDTPTSNKNIGKERVRNVDAPVILWGQQISWEGVVEPQRATSNADARKHKIKAKNDGKEKTKKRGKEKAEKKKV